MPCRTPPPIRLALAALLAAVLPLAPAGDVAAEEVADAGAAAPPGPQGTLVPAEGSPGRRLVRIVYDGETGGISSGLADLSGAGLLYRAAKEGGATVEAHQATLGALYREGRWLWAAGEATLEGATSFLAAPALAPAAPPVSIPILDGVDGVLLALPAAPGAPPPDPATHPLFVAARGEGRQARVGTLTRWRAGDGREAWVLDTRGGDGRGALEPDPNAWEVRERVSLGARFATGPEELVLLAKRAGEGTRRKVAVQRELGALPGVPTLYVSAGGAVEGASFLRDHATSLHRPYSWEGYGEAGLRFLAPSLAELVPGVATLAAESAAAGVELLSCNLVDPEGNPVFGTAATVDLDGVKVAFAGLTDPSVWPLLGPEVRAQVAVAEPLPALERCLDGVEADVVVLLATLAQDTLAEVAGHVTGVDAVLGDFSSGLASGRVEKVVAAPEVPGGLPRERRRPLLISRSSGATYGVLTVSIGPFNTLELLDNRIVTLPQELPPDDGLLRRVMAIRQKVYRQSEDVLIPDLATLPGGATGGGAAAERLDYRRWLNLAGNLVRRHTQADVVMLPPLPWPFDLSGPTRELQALASLAVPDRLVSVHVRGDLLRRMLLLAWSDEGSPERDSEFGADLRTRAGRAAPMVAGAEIGARDIAAWKVRGGAIADAETYHVVLTDRIATRPDFARILSGSRLRSRFHRAAGGIHLPALLGGRDLALRDVVFQALAALRERHPDFSHRYARQVRALLPGYGGQAEPAVVARLDTAAFRLLWNRSHVPDPDAYAEVQEPRASAANSFDVGWNVQGRVGVEAPHANWMNSLLATYTLSRIEGAEPAETQDDLALTTELQVKPADVPVGKGISLWPVVNFTYDSVFDLLENDEHPQRVLREGVGLLVQKLWKPLPTVRIAAFAEQDLSVQGDPAWQAGLSAGLVHEWPIKPVKWRTDVSFFYWFPVPSQDRADDLAYSLNVKSSLAVPIAGSLALSTWADALVFQRKGLGQDPPPPGLSLIVGVDIGFSGSLRARF